MEILAATCVVGPQADDPEKGWPRSYSGQLEHNKRLTMTPTAAQQRHTVLKPPGRMTPGERFYWDKTYARIAGPADRNHPLSHDELVRWKYQQYRRTTAP